MKKRGFTLIEMLIVIVIIGILAVALIPRIGNARDRAADIARMADVRSIATALISYRLDHGSYPESTSQLINDEVDYGLGGVIPTDPDDESVGYGYSKLDEGKHFIVCAHLSNGSKAGNANQDFCNSDRGIKEIPTNMTKPKKSGLSSRFAPEVYAEYNKELCEKNDAGYRTNLYNEKLYSQSFNILNNLANCYYSKKFIISPWDSDNMYLYCPSDDKYYEDKIIIKDKEQYIIYVENHDNNLWNRYKSAWECFNKCLATNTTYSVDDCRYNYVYNDKKCNDYVEAYDKYFDNKEYENAGWWEKHTEQLSELNTAADCDKCYQEKECEYKGGTSGDEGGNSGGNGNGSLSYKEIVKKLGKNKGEYYIYAY